jgi:hypothetical protein
MVDDRITDGRRIAQLLASELDGREGDLAAVSVANANPDVASTPEGAHAYDIRRDGDHLARAFVPPDRVRVRVDGVTPEEALSAARGADLPVHRTDEDPPRVVFVVEDGVAVKRASTAFAVVVAGSTDREYEGRHS